MKTVSIHDAKSNLSKYIAAAKEGETIYIGGFGKPEVRLEKIPEHEVPAQHERLFSIAKGKIVAQDDTFTDATDQAIANMMASGE